MCTSVHGTWGTYNGILYKHLWVIPVYFCCSIITHKCWYKGDFDMIYKTIFDWRLDWSLRTCISTAFVSFLALYPSVYQSYNLEFAAFVCILVKDSTFGATVKNGFACILSSFISSLCCWLLIIIFDFNNPLLFLAFAVLFTAIFQYIGHHFHNSRIRYK
jgi:hypothetical protein